LWASGTINLELAAAGVPQVAVYSTSWLTGFVIRRLLRPVLRHASLPNILAGRTLLTELLFEDCTPCRIAEEADFLLARPSLARAEAAQIRQLVLPSLRGAAACKPRSRARFAPPPARGADLYVVETP